MHRNSNRGRATGGKQTGIAPTQSRVRVAGSCSDVRGGMCSKMLWVANVSSGRTRVDAATSTKPIPWECTSADVGPLVVMHACMYV